MKKFNKYLATLLVVLSIFSIGSTVKALYMETLLYKWQKVTQKSPTGVLFSYNENQQYRDITFTNGYTYTQSSTDITSWADYIAGITSRIQYTRTYRTY